MSAKAGDPCCFCGEKLVFDGERVFCASVEEKLAGTKLARFRRWTMREGTKVR